MCLTSRSLRLLPVLLLSLTAGCDMLGIETPGVVAQQKESEGKAIGSACRHALRAIEDCYTLNPKAIKSSVYSGWREMEEYMRENKLEGIAPVIPRPEPVKPAASAPPPKDPDAEDAEDPADAAPGDKADKAGDKGHGKSGKTDKTEKAASDKHAGKAKAGH